MFIQNFPVINPDGNEIWKVNLEDVRTFKGQLIVTAIDLVRPSTFMYNGDYLWLIH